jgi:N-acetylmuramoyl-L-alanine amidase
LRRPLILLAVVFASLAESWPLAQATAPPQPLRLISSAGRRPIPTSIVAGEELIAADDLAGLLQVAVREDTQAGGLTVTYRGQTALISLDRPLASVNGRVVALPSAPMRVGGRWLLPLEALPRAIGPIHDQRIDLRRSSRLLVIGDLRVPRVLARVEQVGPASRATFDVIPAANVATQVESGQVQLRIDADALDMAPPTGGPFPFGFFEQIRAAEALSGINVTLTSTAGTARATTSTADNVTRIVIDVPPVGAAPAESALPRPPALPAPGETASVPTPLGGVPVTTIVLDPGHGGTELGAQGLKGTTEKAIALLVARRLRGLLEARLGARVLLTRDDDREVGLDERAAFANNSKADIFVSLHANAAPSAIARGVEVLYADMGQEGEDQERAANASAVTLPVLGGGTRLLELVRWDLAQAPHVAQSAALAAALDEALRQQLPMGARGVRQLPLRVLSGVNMPAALVEIGYLTNTDEEARATRDGHQDLLARGIADGLAQFRQALDALPR